MTTKKHQLTLVRERWVSFVQAQLAAGKTIAQVTMAKRRENAGTMSRAAHPSERDKAYVTQIHWQINPSTIFFFKGGGTGKLSKQLSAA